MLPSPETARSGGGRLPCQPKRESRRPARQALRGGGAGRRAAGSPRLSQRACDNERCQVTGGAAQIVGTRSPGTSGRNTRTH